MHHSLSLWSAIQININIMLGTGLFINTVHLARLAGPFGALSYGTVGLILLPLIITIARMVELHPQGGFYGFGSHEINTFAGFISTWVYFAGKLASASLMIHASTTLLRLLIPACATINHLLFDTLIIGIFALLNLGNLRMGNLIQMLFFNAKIVPIIIIMLIAICYYNPLNYATITIALDQFLTTIPLVLYATVGFEAACSLSSRLENARINGPRAILISYSTLIITYVLFQGGLYALLGSKLASLNSFADVFEAVASFLPLPLHGPVTTGLLFCVALSSLGGAYGILFSNMWNLHALAEHNHLWCSSWFKQLSKHKVPLWCVAAEGALAVSYVWLSSGMQLPLQQISGLGSVVAYTISCIAAVYAKRRNALRLSWLCIGIALINCFMLIVLCSTYLIKGGNTALYLFALLIIGGIGMFWMQNKSFSSSI